MNFETSMLKLYVVILCFLIWQLHNANSTQKSSEKKQVTLSKRNTFFKHQPARPYLN